MNCSKDLIARILMINPTLQNRQITSDTSYQTFPALEGVVRLHLEMPSIQRRNGEKNLMLYYSPRPEVIQEHVVYIGYVIDLYEKLLTGSLHVGRKGCRTS